MFWRISYETHLYGVLEILNCNLIPCDKANTVSLNVTEFDLATIFLKVLIGSLSNICEGFKHED